MNVGQRSIDTFSDGAEFRWNLEAAATKNYEERLITLFSSVRQSVRTLFSRGDRRKPDLSWEETRERMQKNVKPVGAREREKNEREGEDSRHGRALDSDLKRTEREPRIVSVTSGFTSATRLFVVTRAKVLQDINNLDYSDGIKTTTKGTRKIIFSYFPTNWHVSWKKSRKMKTKQ